PPPLGRSRDATSQSPGWKAAPEQFEQLEALLRTLTGSDPVSGPFLPILGVPWSLIPFGFAGAGVVRSASSPRRRGLFVLTWLAGADAAAHAPERQPYAADYGQPTARRAAATMRSA